MLLLASSVSSSKISPSLSAATKDSCNFMYDMLSGKQDALKETVKEVDQTSRQAREMALDAKAAARLRIIF